MSATRRIRPHPRINPRRRDAIIGPNAGPSTSPAAESRGRPVVGRRRLRAHYPTERPSPLRIRRHDLFTARRRARTRTPRPQSSTFPRRPFRHSRIKESFEKCSYVLLNLHLVGPLQRTAFLYARKIQPSPARIRQSLSSNNRRMVETSPKPHGKKIPTRERRKNPKSKRE